MVSREDTLADQIKLDYREADLSERERAMLDYVHKLTLTPHCMREQDVERLRANGLDDLAILHVVLLASWFNYINRVAEGLGVRLDEERFPAFATSPPIPWENESATARPPARAGQPAPS